jgi:hypothetical protein
MTHRRKRSRILPALASAHKRELAELDEDPVTPRERTVEISCEPEPMPAMVLSLDKAWAQFGASGVEAAGMNGGDFLCLPKDPRRKSASVDGRAFEICRP